MTLNEIGDLTATVRISTSGAAEMERRAAAAAHAGDEAGAARWGRLAFKWNIKRGVAESHLEAAKADYFGETA